MHQLNTQDHSGITLIRGIYEDGTIYCRIHMAPVFEIDGYKFDLNKNWYYVTLASGKEFWGKYTLTNR